MRKMENYLERAANFISRETERDQEVLLFGLRLVLSFVIGYTLIIILSYLLNVQLYTLTAAITASILRVFSGGGHASSQPRCWLLGIIIFIPIGIFVKSVSPFSKPLVAFIVGIISFYGLVMINKYAPAPTPGKPLSSQLRKDYLRRISFILLSCWGTICLGALFFYHNALLLSSILSSALGMLWQLTSLTPLGYKTIKFIDLGLQYSFNKRKGG